jgi:hypothetical protein
MCVSCAHGPAQCDLLHIGCARITLHPLHRTLPGA